MEWNRGENERTAMSVAAEHASGTIVDTQRVGATTIVVAVTFALFFLHHLLSQCCLLGSCQIFAFYFSTARLSLVDENKNIKQIVKHLTGISFEGGLSDSVLSCSL